MHELAQLQVFGQHFRHLQCVVAVACKIPIEHVSGSSGDELEDRLDLHVGQRSALKHVASEHLTNRLDIELETSDTHLSAEE